MYEHTDYRFDVSEHDGAITRGRAYQMPEDWTTDVWSHYWDSDGGVAFIDGGYRDGVYPVIGCESDETDRAIAAYKAERDSMTGATEALDRLAARLTDNNPGAEFIRVGLDRGTDLYALSWGGDQNGEWRDEIEAINSGDIWRIEVEEFQPGFGPASAPDWVPCDEYPEEFYGEDKAAAEFARIFPMEEFPAELLVSTTD